MSYTEELREYETSHAYAEKIQALSELLITDGVATTEMAPLSALIGCCYTTKDLRGRSYVETPDQPGPEHEQLVTSILLRALRRYAPLSYATQENLFSALHGLCKNERWRECLRTMDDAYDFAAALYLFALCAREGYTQFMVDAIEIEVLAVVNDWTRLPAAQLTWRTLPNTLFGDIWCDLFLNSDDGRFVDVVELIRTTRPQLVPGLLPAHMEPADTILPGDIGG